MDGNVEQVETVIIGGGDNGGEPIHQRCVTSLPGIYFLGIKCLYKRKSHFMLKAGPAEDAAYLAEQIVARN